MGIFLAAVFMTSGRGQTGAGNDFVVRVNRLRPIHTSPSIARGRPTSFVFIIRLLGVRVCLLVYASM